MPIDTQAPAWLQRNWSPRESFDPTPWLQERYNRQINETLIPLKVQGMQLDNQAQQLKIEQQAMMNEEASRQMIEYREQLPSFTTWQTEAAKNPDWGMNNVPNVTNIKLLNMARDYQLMLASTKTALAAKTREIEWQKTVADGMELGIPEPPGGLEDPASRYVYSQRVGAAKRAWELQKIDKQNASRMYDRTLEEAKRVGEAQQELDYSKSMTDNLLPDMESYPDVQSEFQKQRRLEAEINYLQGKRMGSSAIGTGGRSAAGVQIDSLITQYEEIRDTAIASDNNERARWAQQHIDDLKSTHRNYLQMQNVQAMRQRLAGISAEMARLSKTSKQYLELKTQWDEVYKEMQLVGATPAQSMEGGQSQSDPLGLRSVMDSAPSGTIQPIR